MRRRVLPHYNGYAGTIVLLAAALLASPGTAAAQASPKSILAASPDSALTEVLENLPGEILHLENAIQGAAREASQTRIAAAVMEAAGQTVREEKGAFDPEIFATGDWSDSDTPSASLFAGAEVLQSETNEFSTGARILLHPGTEVTASLNSLSTRTNSDFASLDPEYQAYGALTVRQPLLKGFGPATTSDLDFAEQKYDEAKAIYQGAVLAVRAEVESVYWSLYASERNHAVTRLIRDRAEAFYDDTNLRAKAGMVGPSAVANAEFFLTQAEQTLLDTEEEMDRHSDRLASLMGRRPNAIRYRSGDDPPRDFPLVDQDTLVAVVLSRNPDLEALARSADALRALENGAVWDARPTLDLFGGLGGRGLSGSPQDVFFPGSAVPVRTDIDGDRGQSLSQAVGGDYPAWNVGFVFSLPIGNRAGKGQRDRLKAQVVRADMDLVAGQRKLEEDVRAQYRELERGSERLAIATRGVTASIRQVEIGMVEFNNGRTTAFEVVRLAADLATAQQSYSAALVRTARAAAILRQLTGGWYPDSGNQGDPREGE